MLNDQSEIPENLRQPNLQLSSNELQDAEEMASLEEAQMKRDEALRRQVEQAKSFHESYKQ